MLCKCGKSLDAAVLVQRSNDYLHTTSTSTYKCCCGSTFTIENFLTTAPVHSGVAMRMYSCAYEEQQIILGPFDYVHTTYDSVVHVSNDFDLALNDGMVRYRGSEYPHREVYAAKLVMHKDFIPVTEATGKPVYVRLFHGRKTVDEETPDWGFDGPTFECYRVVLDSSVTLYGKRRGKLCIFFTEDLLCYDNAFFGDFTISNFCNDREKLIKIG